MIQDLDEISPVIALKSIKKLLEDPKKWTRNTVARDIDGHFISPHSEKAYSWCIEGAYYTLGLSYNRAVKYLHESAEDMYGKDLVWVNDNIGHAAILNIIGNAIKLAEKEEIKNVT